jgi:hypothetical protein
MSERGTQRLVDMLAGRIAPGRSELPEPMSYEQTTRRMVEKVEDDVRSLRRRLDALIFMVISAILTEAATRFFGG